MNINSQDNTIKQSSNYKYESSEDQAVLDHLSKLLHPEMVFVDVGAGLGKYTFQANKILNKSSIYTIEANPIKFNQLKNNCLDWENLSDNKIHTIQIAISDIDGKTSFYTANIPGIGSVLKSNPYQIQNKFNEIVNWEKITIDSFKIDTLFGTIKPELIKINAPGNELKILEGSKNILNRGNTKFLIKVRVNDADKVEKALDDLYSFMKSFGYYPINFHGMNLFIHPKKCNNYNYMLESSKKIYRRIFPPYFRYWLRNKLKR